MPGGRRKRTHTTAAARARAGKKVLPRSPSPKAREGHITSPPLQPISISDSESSDEGGWDGTVNHWDSSDSEYCWTDDDGLSSEEESGEEVEVEELDGEELNRRLNQELEREIEDLTKHSPYEAIMAKVKGLGAKLWRPIEKKLRSGVYTGASTRTKERTRKKARDKAASDALLRKTPGADMMRAFVTSAARRAGPRGDDSSRNISAASSSTCSARQEAAKGDSVVTDEIFDGYLSDIELGDDVVAHMANNDDYGNELDESDDEAGEQGHIPSHSHSPALASSSTAAPEPSAFQDPSTQPNLFNVREPPQKRRKLEVPVREMKRRMRERKKEEMRAAHTAIDKLIRSKKRDTFDGGHDGLQASRARAIRALLEMVLDNGRRWMDASERAAEVMGFARNTGSRMLRVWTKEWIMDRTLPRSRRGRHGKTFSFLDDPTVRAMIRSYVRSNKWAMDPAKLADFTAKKMVPEVAKKYLEKITDDEMPRGLIRYLELELFPRVHMRVKKGVSLSTARRWLRKEGFAYTEHKKGLYFDGHERPDVVDYRQTEFLPAMGQHRKRLVEYVVGDVEKEVMKDRGGERKLVLVAHDEMTAQANDGKKKSWVLEGEQPLRKKGVGRGLHQSDVICSTVGWIKEASQTLEYGKNYEGYWTGELFIKQLIEKIIPAFEKLHPPSEYQALFMVDNSQGHSAYSEDALIASRMNLKPGGKQPKMHKTWFLTADGERVEQDMVFPDDHPKFGGQPKGMKQVLVERGLWKQGMLMACKEKCAVGSTSCCARRVLESEPDFTAQKSLVQEVIEARGHLCIFLPKFHCELNFIEFFWGAVKRYLRENCDYTFETLKTNMPLALESVPLATIRKWEHRMIRWMEAYRGGLGAREAQFQVKQFSSRAYTSHRRVPETLAAAMDQ